VPDRQNSLEIIRQRESVIEPVREYRRLEGLRLVAGDNILRPLAFRIAALYRHHIDIGRRHLPQRESIGQLQAAIDREISVNGGEIDVFERPWGLSRLQWYDLDAPGFLMT